jgi:hypothetical protein
MRLRQSLTAPLVALVGVATLVGVAASAAQAATTAVTLPITQYSQMLVDPVHHHLFITSGYGSASILVTDYSGQTVAVIPNEQGATGLALSSDGTTVYAGLANADAVSAISTSTLIETARYSTGVAAPYYVAYSSGKVWFSYNSPISNGIGSIDPSTSPATVTLDVGAGFWQFAPILAASPGGVLAAAEILFSPVRLATYDVSSGTAVVLAPQQLLSGGGDARSLQITPDGQDVLLASGGVSYVQEFQASDLSPVPSTYGANGLNSFSVSSSGLAAVGACCGLPGSNIVVMESSAGTTVNAYDFDPNRVANDGVALTSDGSELFVITLNGSYPGTPTLNVVSNPGFPPCTQGTTANFRWHYRASGTSGGWSGTKAGTCPGMLSMGPQAMEGNLKVAPGTALQVGYDLTIPGNRTTQNLAVLGPQVTFAVRCVSGATPSAPTFTVTMPDAAYTVSTSAWYPSSDQSSPLVYQGSATVPDLCGGGQLSLGSGGTFTTTLG